MKLEQKMKHPNTNPAPQLYRASSTLRIRPKSSGNYVQHCNQVYAEAHGVGLTMDVFVPEDSENGLAIVDVVSGGWFSDRSMLNLHMGLGVFDVLCDHGYTVFALSPGSLNLFTGLEMVRHVDEGIRFIKTEAQAFGIDPKRLGLTGFSAGGHLASLMYARSVFSFPQRTCWTMAENLSSISLRLRIRNLIDYCLQMVFLSTATKKSANVCAYSHPHFRSLCRHRPLC